MNRSNNYTVYMHIAPNDKKYVGITCQKPIYRWDNGNGYKQCTLMWRAICKYGWDNFAHEILYKNLSKEEAEQKEIELISKYKSNNKNYGYNIENGGNSVGKMSEETKLKISIAERGKKMSEEAKQKMKGRIPWNKGRKCTLEERLKTRKANPNKKKVICLNTGVIYESIAEAGRQLNINKVCIRQNCNGKYNYAGNHLQFRFVEEVQQ